MINLFGLCKTCPPKKKRSLYVCQRSYNFYWLPIKRINSQEKICMTCKRKVIKMIKHSTPPPDSGKGLTWKTLKKWVRNKKGIKLKDLNPK